MMKLFISLGFIVLLSGCSFFSSRLETLTENKSSRSTLLNPAKNNYCKEYSNFQYISEDENSLGFYKKINSNLLDNKNYSFIKKVIMLSLIEMSRRPDEASPYSRLQVFFKLNNNKYYYDIKPKSIDSKIKMPYLKGLEFLTQKFLPSESLLSIGNELDTIIPKEINVSTNFEDFLRINRDQLIKNETITDHFFKGDETLTKFETFERISYRNIISQYMNSYNKNTDYDLSSDGINSYKINKENFQVSCNIDLDKQSSLKENTLASEIRNSHYIGFKDGENFFLAVMSNQLIRPFETEKSSYFMKANASSTPIPICEFKGDNQEITLFSGQGRDPLQHLQHLVAYEINKVDSSAALNELLSFSRHLFLSNPDRILYESKRGRKSQLEFFLSMNFPIYHVDNLGNIFGFASFKKRDKTTRGLENNLHIDDRIHARLWCKP